MNINAHDLSEMRDTIRGVDDLIERATLALAQFLAGERIPLTLAPTEYDRPHCRTTMRVIEAVDELGIGRAKFPALGKSAIRQVAEEAWKDPRLTAFGSHNLYTTANILYLARDVKSAVAGSAGKVLQGFVDEELRRDAPNMYLLLFAFKALGRDRPSTKLSKAARRVLFDQLVFHSAESILDFDSAQLAASAILLSMSEPSDVELTESQHFSVIARAAEVLLAADNLQGAMRLPRPQYGKDNAVIHAIAHEEMLLATQLPLRYMPLDQGSLIITVRSLMGSFLNLPNGEMGWTIESDKDFPSPMSWTTAIYTRLLTRASRVLKYAYTESYLRLIESSDRTRVIRLSDENANDPIAGWSSILETEQGAKSLIEERILGGPAATPVPKTRSLLLFGPPGTAKTTLIRGIASQLERRTMCTFEGERWPMLIVNPSDVLGDGGYSGVVANLKVLFAELRCLSEVVVFFDEAENIVFGRSVAGESREDRMMTASMLPLLNNIEDDDIVFVMATNYIRDIDSAVRRRGRFGLRVGMGPPDRASRERLMSGRLSQILDPSDVGRLVEGSEGLTVRELLDLSSAVERAVEMGDVSIESLLEQASARAEISGPVMEAFLSDLEQYHDGLVCPASS